MAGQLLVGHLRNFGKRLFYNYYLRDVAIASIELPLGLPGVLAGTLMGSCHWIHSASLGETTPAGTVMLATLPVLAGLQLLLAFVHDDIAAVPRRPLPLAIHFAEPARVQRRRNRRRGARAVCGDDAGPDLGAAPLQRSDSGRPIP